jgi:mannose-6-phosphate isomerase-like protein (cupin superfamily)
MTVEPMHLRCACGWEASGTEDELVAAATEHGERVHNMRPTHAEVLAMVVAEPASGSDARSRHIILRPGEGRSIDLGNFAMSVKATAEDTNGAFTLLEADEPEGFGPPMHIHRDAAEAFYVVAGEYVIFVRDEEFVCPAGSFVYIPAGVPHGFRVGPVRSRKLNLYTPAAMIGYFDEMSAAIASRGADAELAAIAERHGMDVIGPVPDGYL